MDRKDVKAVKELSTVSKHNIYPIDTNGFGSMPLKMKVNAHVMAEVVTQLNDKIISVPMAMKRLGLTSRSTFYRKLKAFKMDATG